jgi:hypothetical protein
MGLMCTLQRCMNARSVLSWQMGCTWYEILLMRNVSHYEPKEEPNKTWTHEDNVECIYVYWKSAAERCYKIS